MKRLILALIGLTLIAAAGLLAHGVNIKIKLSIVPAHFDPRFVDGKFYRRPIHPGFITQKHPVLISRVAKSKGPLKDGLPTAIKYGRR